MNIYLREIREENEMSMGQLAKKSGLSKATISNIEGGMIEPKLITIAKLCIALKVELNDMVDIWK